MDPFGRKINLILWRNEDGMFLGRLCMEHYIIDHMLLEDKLKEISVKKWCVGSDTNRRILIVILVITEKLS